MIEDTLDRARRNLVVMSSFVLMYVSCAIDINVQANGVSWGLPVRISSEVILELWLMLFLLYFYWRFYASMEGGDPFSEVRVNIETVLRHLSEVQARDYFLLGNAQVKSEPSKYNFSHVGSYKQGGFLLGELNIPIIGLSWMGSPAVYPADLRESNHRYYIMTREETYKVARSIFKKQIFSHSAFSEMVMPCIVGFLACELMAMRLGYVFMSCFLKGAS